MVTHVVRSVKLNPLLIHKTLSKNFKKHLVDYASFIRNSSNKYVHFTY